MDTYKTDKDFGKEYLEVKKKIIQIDIVENVDYCQTLCVNIDKLFPRFSAK